MADNEIEIVEQRTTWFGGVDWGSILAAVVAGLGITFLLVSLGIAIGMETDESAVLGDEAATLVGTWSVISALIGMLVGGFVGGRFSRWLTTGASIYHGLTAWGLMVVISIWLGVTGAVGMLGSGLVTVLTRNFEERTSLANVISWNGWALFVGMLLTLLVTVTGWWIGARMRLATFEQGDVVTASKHSVDLGEPGGGERVRT